jgi:hypothetical protein
VCVYSRYAFIKLLKTKSAKNVANKFEQILIEENEIPEKIQSDEGTEFAIIKRELAAKYNFKLFHTFNRETKAVHAERFIQTIKQMIRRTLTHFHSYNYTKYLPAIVERYNEAPHSSLFGKSPKDIYIKRRKLDEFKVLKNMLNGSRPTKNLLHVGDRVRISRVKNNVFEKSSLRRWVNEKFLIKKVFITDPVTYEIEDEKGENIQGVFYRQELQKV